MDHIQTDLHTINTVQCATLDLIKSKVQDLEQSAFDADKEGFIEYSKQLTHAARELDLIAYQVSSLHTDLFLDELDRRNNPVGIPIVSTHRDVDLPDLSGPEVINTTATHV